MDVKILIVWEVTKLKWIQTLIKPLSSAFRSRGGTPDVPNGFSELFVYISARAYIYMMGYVCSHACIKPGTRTRAVW